MILKCAIIDDEPLALGLMASYARKTPVLELCGTYSSAIEAMKSLPDNPVDLLFLDIQMPELNGLEFSRMVPENTRIIFTTAFEQYAIDGYRVNALDYLLKPISFADFSEAVNKAVSWFSMKQKAEINSARQNDIENDINNGYNGKANSSRNNSNAAQTSEKLKDSDINAESNDKDSILKQENESANGNYIYVKSDYKLIQIELDKILYIEGLKDYIKIYTEDNPRPVMSLVSMKAMEEKLPSDRFIRVHRSFIVQKKKIKIIDKGRIVFGKEYIPISDSYKQVLQNYVNKHTI
ncbi:LytR/AlgR family response regulator transcription factor [Phocaeicola plebeius]|uniref:LytR/AlgR family response regulator transcription factor n=1 Tax=Phocaeicola plebeius TaxID=310297 RepID=UPI003AB13F74